MTAPGPSALARAERLRLLDEMTEWAMRTFNYPAAMHDFHSACYDFAMSRLSEILRPQPQEER